MKDEDDKQLITGKNKFFTNKVGLKHEGGSMGEKLMHSIIPQDDIETNSSAFLKKKSHTNLNMGKVDGNSPDKDKKNKKLSKMMSEEKNLKVNLDVNVKINLKINPKERKDIREQI
jgi:hypothetical protein